MYTSLEIERNSEEMLQNLIKTVDNSVENKEALPEALRGDFDEIVYRISALVLDVQHNSLKSKEIEEN